jgi:ankyrin repeat protein
MPQTPLHLAAASGTPAQIKSLLTADADPNARDDHNQTPLEVAANLGRTAAVKALLAKPPADPTPWLLLSTFAQRGGKKDQAVLAALLTVLHPDAPPPPGYGYALHVAANDGFPHSVQALLTAGADINRLDHQGFTPAHLAIAAATAGLFPRPNHVAAYQTLVAAGADIDLPCHGTTARALAAKLPKRSTQLQLIEPCAPAPEDQSSG